MDLIYKYAAVIFLFQALITSCDTGASSGGGGLANVDPIMYKSHETFSGGRAVFSRSDLENEYLLALNTAQFQGADLSVSISVEVRDVGESAGTEVFSVEGKAISSSTTYLGVQDGSSGQSFTTAEWNSLISNAVPEGVKHVVIAVRIMDGSREVAQSEFVKDAVPLSHIYTWRDLTTVMLNPAGDYVQQTDIVFPEPGELGTSSEGFLPIGTNQNPFTGSYDGKGHTIKGLTIRHTRSVDWQGLFGYVSFASKGSSGFKGLENIHLIDAIIDLNEADIGTTEVGALVGYMSGDSNPTTTELKNIFVSGTSRIEGGEFIGGIAGKVINVYASELYSEARVQGGGFYVGGVFGETNNSFVEKVFGRGDVTGQDNVGGIVGLATTSTFQIVESRASVDGRINIGGVIGRVYNPQLNTNAASLLYVLAITSVSGKNKLGGVIGSGENIGLLELHARTEIVRTVDTFSDMQPIIGDYTNVIASNQNAYFSSASTVKDNLGNFISIPSIFGSIIDEETSAALSDWREFTSGVWNYAGTGSHPTLVAVPVLP